MNELIIIGSAVSGFLMGVIMYLRARRRVAEKFPYTYTFNPTDDVVEPNPPRRSLDYLKGLTWTGANRHGYIRQNYITKDGYLADPDGPPPPPPVLTAIGTLQPYVPEPPPPPRDPGYTGGAE